MRRIPHIESRLIFLPLISSRRRHNPLVLCSSLRLRVWAESRTQTDLACDRTLIFQETPCASKVVRSRSKSTPWRKMLFGSLQRLVVRFYSCPPSEPDQYCQARDNRLKEGFAQKSL